MFQSDIEKSLIIKKMLSIFGAVGLLLSSFDIKTIDQCLDHILTPKRKEML